MAQTISMTQVIDFLNYLRNRFYYTDGLFVLLLLTGAGYLLISSYLGPSLVLIIASCGWTWFSSLKPFFFLGALFTLECLALALWLWHRAFPRFGKNEFGIIFSPNFPKELEGEVQRLLFHLTQEIKSKQLDNRFAIKTLPPNKTINSPEEATATIKKCGGTVAVWGLIETQLRAEGTKTGFSRISFTVVHPPILPGSGYHRRLLAPLAGRKWHIDERNRIIDRNLLAQNIGLVVRNLIGLALLCARRFEDATKIFLPLCAELIPITNSQSPLPVRQFCADVKEDAAICLAAGTQVAYFDFLRTDRLFSIPSTTLQAWLNNINEAIKLDPQNSNHFLLKSLYLFLLGDVPKAIKAAQRSRDLAPKAVSAPNFSLAFLYVFNGNFKKTRAEYRRALAKKTSYHREMLRNIFDFIRQAVVKFPEKPQLRFALGFLELNRGDPQTGQREIAKFLEQVPANHPSLSEFVAEARRLIAP